MSSPDTTSNATGSALSCLLALAAGCAALLHLGAVGDGGPQSRALLAVCALPALAFGAGLPVLLRWSPVEPSALKLLLFSTLLSLPLVALVWFGWRQLLAPSEASGATLGLIALAQLGCLGRPLRFERPGWAALAALALGGVLAAGAFFSLHPSSLAVQGGDGLYHAAVAQVLGRAGPLEDPLLAGTPLLTHPGYAGLVAAFAGASGVHPLAAGAWLQVLGAGLLPLALYLAAAPLWREPRRAVLGVLLALIGAGAWSVLAAPLGAPALGLLPLEVLLRPGPGALSLLYAAGLLCAAAHSLRHGLRPWAGLTGLCLFGCAALDPWSGAVLGSALLLSLGTASAPLGRRAALLAVCAAWGVGAGALVWCFGDRLVLARPLAPGAWTGALCSAAPLALCALGLWGGRWRGAGGAALPQADSGSSSPSDGRGRLAIGMFFGLAAALPLALAIVADGSRAEPEGLAWLAALPLGLLAGGGLVDLLSRGGGLRVGGALLGLAVLAGGGWSGAEAARAAHAKGTTPGPLSVVGARALPRPEAAHLELPAFLDEQREALEEHRDAVLLAPLDALPFEGGPVHCSLGVALDLPLWVDRSEARYAGGAAGDVRRTILDRLYRDDKHGAPQLSEQLAALERPCVFLVRELDRRRTAYGPYGSARGVELRLLRLGARVLARTNEVALLLLEPGTRP